MAHTYWVWWVPKGRESDGPASLLPTDIYLLVSAPVPQHTGRRLHF